MAGRKGGSRRTWGGSPEVEGANLTNGGTDCSDRVAHTKTENLETDGRGKIRVG